MNSVATHVLVLLLALLLPASMHVMADTGIHDRDEARELVQRKSTIAFGYIEDDYLKTWIEYFDDKVGSYQWIGAMPLYAEDEEPYPWPARATLLREYWP